MTPPPTVSIIMPAYNAAATLPAAVASVQAQTFVDWELMVVDDGSIDTTPTLVAAMAAADPRIRMLRQTNHGVAASRRAGIAVAGGRYIAFLDADDAWLPMKLEKQLAFMAETGAPVSYTAFRRFNDVGQVGALIPALPTLTYRTMLTNSALPNLTGMIDRAQVKNVSIPDMRHEDFAMWLGILRAGHTAYGLNEDLARYRVSAASVSANKARAIGWVWRIYREQERIPVVLAALYIALWGFRALWKRKTF
jgi:teichuronic acid biosynthesis glycosyltransferase TuaG